MDQQLRLNPFFRVRLGPPLTCDLLLEGVSLRLPSPDYLAVFAAIDKPMTTTEVGAVIETYLGESAETAQDVVNDMLTRHLLVPADQRFPEMESVKHWIERGWIQALFLHLRTRDLGYIDDKPNPNADRNELFRELLEQQGPPSFWTEYPDAPVVALPDAAPLPDRALNEVLLARRSNQPWTRKPMTLPALSAILGRANVETRRIRVECESRFGTEPRALLHSAFTALETYFFAFNVDGLDPGLYHYHPRDHELAQVRAGDLSKGLVQMCIGQRKPGTAAGAFVVCVNWQRYQYRYRHSRAYRTLFVNVAELAHKYIVLATSFKLSTFITPALKDEFAAELMQLNEWKEAPQYVVAVG